MAPLGDWRPSAVHAASASSGLLFWHPHYSVRLAAGLVASVDLADGHLDLTAASMALPARGLDLALVHTWDSTQAQAGAATWAGQGWYTTLSQSMSGAPGSTVTYTDSSGAAYVFPYSGGVYQTPAGLPWTLTANGSGYTLTNILTGEVRTFDSSGRYTTTTDSYGNANTLSYTGNTPTGDANSGVRALTLAYTSGLLTDVQSPLWISSSGAQGQHVTYRYGSTGCGSTQLCTLTRGAGTGDAVSTGFGYAGNNLTSVTTGGGHTWTFGYTGSQLTSITSPISGTVGQAGYTPAYTTAITYAAGQTTVAQGQGTTGELDTVYTLDANGEATQVQDGLGHTVQASYGTDHEVLTSTDGNLNVTTLHYSYVGSNASTALVSEIDYPAFNAYYPTHAAVAPKDTFSYDPSTNDLLEADTANGSRTRYSYDGHHSVQTEADLTSGSATWRGQYLGYDAFGELTSLVDGRGVTITVNNNIPTVTKAANAASYTSQWNYNGSGDLTSALTPSITTTLHGQQQTGSVTTTYNPDGDGNATSITSANGDTTNYSYDHLGRPNGSTLPQVTLYTGSNATPSTSVRYDGDGNVATQTDGNGDPTNYSYDPLGRLISTTSPVGAQSLRVYNATTLTSLTDAQHNTTQYSYDAAGRLTNVLDAAGENTAYGYDNANNLTSIANGDGHTALQTETLGYDSNNQVATDTIQGPSTPAQTTTTSYDLNGNLVRTAFASGATTFPGYDLTDQLTSLEGDAGAPNTPAGNPHDTLSYDSAANLITSTDADGRATTNTVDAADRLTIAQSKQGTSTESVFTSYDPNGSVVGQTFSASFAGNVINFKPTYTYNAAAWLTATDDYAQGVSQWPTVDLNTSYGYDGAGRLRTESYAGGTLNITLDGAGRATGLSDGTTSATFGYNGNDLPTSMSLPGGVSGSIQYDGASRLTHLGLSGPGGVSNPLSSTYDYGYDSTGWTNAITSTVSGAQTVQTFTHNALGQLTGVTSGGGTESFSYDTHGNLTADGTQLYCYSATNPDQLIAIVNLSCRSVATKLTYDNHGNEVSNTLYPHSYAYTYTPRDQLSTVFDGSTKLAQMVYNAAGQRAVYINGTGTTAPTWQFSYRGSELGQVSYRDSSTAYTDTYLYTPEGAPYELLRTQNSVTSRYYYQLDGQGSVVALTDSTGNVVDRYSYDAWGKLTSATESVPQRLRYRGYWYDTELGTYALGARTYDPSLRRFLQPDPDPSGGVFDYSYVGDDPVDGSDASGLAAGTQPNGSGGIDLVNTRTGQTDCGDTPSQAQEDFSEGGWVQDSAACTGSADLLTSITARAQAQPAEYASVQRRKRKGSTAPPIDRNDCIIVGANLHRVPGLENAFYVAGTLFNGCGTFLESVKVRVTFSAYCAFATPPLQNSLPLEVKEAPSHLYRGQTEGHRLGVPFSTIQVGGICTENTEFGLVRRPFTISNIKVAVEGIALSSTIGGTFRGRIDLPGEEVFNNYNGAPYT